MDRDDDLERYFYSVFNKMMSAFNSGAVGVKISIDPEGNVHIDPIKPRKRKIYIPYEVVEMDDQIVLTIDIRNTHHVRAKITEEGILITTPKGERYIKFPSSVMPSSAEVQKRDGIVEITLKKGREEGEKLINL